jgi:16S rRNA (adenine1518-N6/adenine1519-N6)-dimethyltransferase
MNFPHPATGAHVTKKRFGQHFLHDKNILRRIVEAVSPRPGDRIVEIGPGEGALTFPLLQAAGTLTTIELDRDLIEPLRARAAGVGELTIVHRDVLSVDFGALAEGGVLRLVGNLPYNISTPILFHCLDHAAAIEDMHFMLQKEVVDRMAAGPGSKTYGRLSVMLQLRCSVEPLFGVPPGAFRPPPKVESAVVRLVPLTPSQLRDAGFAGAAFATIERVVRAAFGQRRKTLSNALSTVADPGQIAAAGIDPRARAEQLAPAEFVALARHLDAATGQAG